MFPDTLEGKVARHLYNLGTPNHSKTPPPKDTATAEGKMELARAIIAKDPDSTNSGQRRIYLELTALLLGLPKPDSEEDAKHSLTCIHGMIVVLLDKKENHSYPLNEPIIVHSKDGNPCYRMCGYDKNKIGGNWFSSSTRHTRMATKAECLAFVQSAGTDFVQKELGVVFVDLDKPKEAPAKDKKGDEIPF